MPTIANFKTIKRGQCRYCNQEFKAFEYTCRYNKYICSCENDNFYDPKYWTIDNDVDSNLTPEQSTHYRELFLHWISQNTENNKIHKNVFNQHKFHWTKLHHTFTSFSDVWSAIAEHKQRFYRCRSIKETLNDVYQPPDENTFGPLQCAEVRYDAV